MASISSITTTETKPGSEQESVKVLILGGFLQCRFLGAQCCRQKSGKDAQSLGASLRKCGKPHRTRLPTFPQRRLLLRDKWGTAEAKSVTAPQFAGVLNFQ